MCFDHFTLLHSCYILIFECGVDNMIFDVIGSDFGEFEVLRGFKGHIDDFDQYLIF